MVARSFKLTHHQHEFKASVRIITPSKTINLLFKLYLREDNHKVNVVFFSDSNSSRNPAGLGLECIPSEAVLYTELLLSDHGLPQWIPEPDASPGGHEDGIRIGDVGIIDPHRAFDSLFNICDSSTSGTDGLPQCTLPMDTVPQVQPHPNMWKSDYVISSVTMDRIDNSLDPSKVDLM